MKVAKTQLCGAMRQDSPRPSGHSHPLGSGSPSDPLPGAMSQARTSFLEQMPGTVVSGAILSLAWTPRLWCLSRGCPCWGLYHRPPIPARAPRGLVSNGHSPWVHVLGPTAAGRSLGGPSPHQVHAHVEQLSPKAQESGGTPGRRPPPQGQPYPQLRAGSGGHRPARGPEGPRGPACGCSSHPSWVTRAHTNPLLPEVRGGSAQGGCEVRGSGHQGPAPPVLGGPPARGPRGD